MLVDVHVRFLTDTRCLQLPEDSTLSQLYSDVADEWGISEDLIDLEVDGEPLPRETSLCESDITGSSIVETRQSVRGRALQDMEALQLHGDPTQYLHMSCRGVQVKGMCVVGTAELCLDAGADPRSMSPTSPLIIAVVLGEGRLSAEEQLGIAEALITAGADPNVRDAYANTALHYTAWVPETGLAEVLLGAGAQASARNSSGDTPLHNAASVGNLGLVHLLLEAGADAAAQAVSGWTPLAAACFRGDTDIMSALLGARPPLCRLTSGETLVSLAVSSGNPAAVLLALQHGMSPYEVDAKQGLAPLQLARAQARDPRIVALLSLACESG